MENYHFLSKISEDSLILTPNRRLASFLQNYYTELQIAKGSLAWPAIQIFPLSNWVELLWNKGVNDTRLVLSDIQELLLWEKIIKKCSIEPYLLNIHATAQLVKDSWHLFNHWHLKLEQFSQYVSLDVQCFVQFISEFKAECIQRHYISQAELLTNLIGSEDLHKLTPSTVYFLGFEEFSPAIQSLRCKLQVHSIVETITSPNTQKATIFKTSFIDQEQELREMARWAYRCNSLDENASIACILPNLVEKRNQVVRIFTQVFYAEKLNTELPPSFNISASQHLIDYPIIKTAISILLQPLELIPLSEFSQLLRSPFIGHAESEADERARFDTWLRSTNEFYIHPVELLTSSKMAHICPEFYRLLKHLNEIKLEQKQSNTLESWIMNFTEQLTSMGWPGEISLNSHEFQIIERFKSVLDEFITLETIYSEASYEEALNLLQKIIKQTMFQPKTTNTSIQVLGMLEASGLSFDHLWIAQLDNETWPGPASPNPFIPIQLQKKYQMPHASAERELQFSINLTKGFISSAKNIIFSYAQMDGERSLLPSALIIDYPSLNLTSTSSTLEEKIFRTKKMEFYLDERGPPILDNISTGGSGLFKAQAACPFQAFSRYRLNAISVENPQFGITASERGNIIHDVLAGIWNEIKTHQKLCELTTDTLYKIINNQIHSSLLKFKFKKPNTLKKTLFSLESQRLAKTISLWLEIEKNRQPFEVITTEQKEFIQMGSLKVRVQLDRLDQLEDGSHFIIDYKTGRTNVLDWFDERPNEPQLPLYSLLFEKTLSGILFAKLRTGNLNYEGVTLETHLVPSTITPNQLAKYNYEFSSISDITEYWKEQLHVLAEEFCQGIATVSPKDNETCQFCELHSLCRIE